MKSFATLAIALVMLALPAQAALEITHPAYAFATAPQQKAGAVFLTLKNTGQSDVNVISASISDGLTETVELHTMKMMDGMMMMREVPSFPVPAGGELTLEPTGDHIMLMGLKAPLALDQTFPLTLSFDGQDDLTLDVKVVKPGFKHE